MLFLLSQRLGEPMFFSQHTQLQLTLISLDTKVLLFLDGLGSDITGLLSMKIP